jgi:hypothetical protein
MFGGMDPVTGMYTGMEAWKELDGDTQAILIRYQEMQDQELPTEQRRAIHNDIITGKWRERNIANAFRNDEGKPDIELYNTMRDSYAVSVFGKKVQDLPEDFAKQIDSATKSFLAVYGPDKEAAVRHAVESVATLWTPNKLGTYGFIPSELAGLKLTNSQLDRAFGNYVDGQGHVYGGAGFTTTTRGRNGQPRLPRARLDFVDNSQLPEGVGNYRVSYFDIDGNFQSSRYVNIDVVLSKYFGNEATYQEKVRQGRTQTARERRDYARAAIDKAAKQQPVMAPRRGRDY